MPTFPQGPNAGLVSAANFVHKTAAYTALDGDFVEANTVTTGAFTVTLPTVAPTLINGVLTAEGAQGPVTVRNVSGTNAVTVKTADGTTIDGVTGTTGIAYTTIHSGATFVVDDTGNWVVANN